MHTFTGDEQIMIAHAREGSLCALNELFRRYESLAYRIALRITGEPGMAEDAVQDGFLSAYRALDSFQPGSFKAWLLRIVTNACYDQLRRRQRRPTCILDTVRIDDRLGTRTETPDSYTVRADLRRVLRTGLQTLSEHERTAVVLSDIEGLCYREIAEVTGVKLGTVKSRLYRGRMRLRDYLRESELIDGSGV